MSPTRRLIAAVSASLLAVPLAAGVGVGSAAAATLPPARNIATFACNPATVPAAAYSDVTASNVFAPAIDCVSGYQVAFGYTNGTYGPTNAVTRGEMALFVYRTATLTDQKFNTAPAGFTDISNLPPAQQSAINALAHAGVVFGVTSTRYAPAAPVTRAQMASFLNRLEAKIVGTSGFPTPSTDYFADIAQSVHRLDIDAIAGVGIAQGTGNDRFSPDLPVNRGEMAAFLTRFVDAAVNLGQLPSAFPAGNAAFTSVPAQGSEAAADYSQGAVTDTVTVGRAASVDIALLPATAVTAPAGGGPVTFSSTTPIASGGAVSIESVNGKSTGATPGSSAVTQENGVTPSSGTVTFTVGANALADVVPVVWADLPGASGGKADNALDVTSAGLATEPFVAGGQLDFVPPEAPTGSSSPTVVSSPYAVNDALGYFVGTSGTLLGQNTYTYYFNGPYDKFGSPSASDIGKAAFEGMLTPQDVLSVSYNTDQAQVSTFTVSTDYVPPVTNLTAVAGSFVPGDTPGSDVQLTFTASPQPDAVYQITPNVSGGTATTYTPPGGNGTQTHPAQLTVTLPNQPKGSYTYSVVASSPTSGSKSATATSNQVQVPSVLQVLPHGAIVTHDAPYAGQADSGDVLTVYFNQPVQLGSSPALAVSDSSTAAMISASNATFALNSAPVGLSQPGEVLTIHLTGKVAPSAGTGSLAYPLTITGASGIVSAGTQQAWSPPTGSAAVTVGVYGPDFIASNATVGAATFTVAVNQPLTGTNAGSLTNPLAYQVSNGGNPDPVQSVSVSSDGLTLTITVGQALAAGATIQTSPTVTMTGANGQSGAMGPFTLTS